ncbi:Asp-tRNA(Asn)/Glu-tRNA(Gln) amidotransferase subunit GatC [Lusitaniella coriacea LEGE 07157]|uniref:Aspartyl/glutamyl-tRNA(Asn/Gln) amidotransferase subunit C n=1 Tax=Lusitaniella coriacea LEGE 07157 TaxID=945747 RepID=A0A8J7J6X3_9CYAN|nr:Asp-tRNA(Asn)/Glu-tRNA(Gln) amidotransferase subunit GatC [Lusitaniella coriacea]MBE9119029.1 Asp-tRNA(Asn)/Glu-tRNA(Gln) amidotransferase subunit GatC [Lusitaniella coriacea LEGE 07157]
MIDREQVHKVAHLARLDLTPTEEEQFTTQLSSILEYFEQLGELDTTEVEPMTRVIEVSNVTRPDVLHQETDPESILQEAPEPEGEYFRVPQILSTDED